MLYPSFQLLHSTVVRITDSVQLLFYNNFWYHFINALERIDSCILDFLLLTILLINLIYFPIKLFSVLQSNFELKTMHVYFWPSYSRVHSLVFIKESLGLLPVCLGMEHGQSQSQRLTLRFGSSLSYISWITIVKSFIKKLRDLVCDIYKFSFWIEWMYWLFCRLCHR